MTSTRAQAERQAATSPVATDVTAPEAPSRANGLLGGLEGYAAQAARLSPQGQVGGQPVAAPDAAHGAATTTQVAPSVTTDASPVAEPASADAPAGPEALSPIRQAIIERCNALDGKGVGDKEFDAICTETWWRERQELEKNNKKYNKEQLATDVAKWERERSQHEGDKEWLKKHPKPMRKDDSHFTTCIAAQSKVLEMALQATGTEIKDSKVLSYGTMGRLEAKKRGAWVEAKVGMSERPKPGDILVLEMRGAPDKVQADIDGESSAYSLFATNVKSLEKQLAQQRAAAQSTTAAIAAAATAKVPQIEQKLAALRAAHDAKIAALQVKLDEARLTTAATAGTERALKGGNRVGGLEFSHVGIFTGSQPELDASGLPTGREIWSTFDGGAHVPGKVDDQGAKSGKRIYDPRTNEIVGAKTGPGGIATQDGKTRWLGGWTNVDSLVTPAQRR
ncbi:MAG: hypothetical protein AMXMBFR64_07090 [Myxococcales bacterium]